MKKLFKSFLALFTFIIAVVTLVAPYGVLAANVQNSITVTTSPATLGYIGYDVNFGRKTLADGTLAYCLDYTMATPVTTTVGLIGEADAGMAYLMENGFPNKSITGDNDKDYFITQTAIWWYLDLTAPKATGNYGLTDGFKTTDSDPQNLRPIIKDLVSKAINAKNHGYKNPSITATINNSNLTINSDKTYFVSEAITVNSTDVDTYTVDLSEAPEGSYVTDLEGNVKNTFASNEQFIVYVAVNDNREDVSFNVKINTTATYNKVYKYLKAADIEQDILLAVLYPETKDANTELLLNVDYPEIEVPNTNSSAVAMNLLGSFTIVLGLLLTRKYAKNTKKVK